jgi:hypothetical protein
MTKKNNSPTYCKKCSSICMTTNCQCKCHDKLKKYWDKKRKESKIIHPMVAGNIHFDKAEIEGFKYLKSLGYKQIKKSIFTGIFDFVSDKGVFEVKAKKLPSTQPYTINFTYNQITYYRKYYPKKISYFKVLINIFFPDGHSEWRILDFTKDFSDIHKKINHLRGREGREDHGCIPIRFRVKQEKRDW